MGSDMHMAAESFRPRPIKVEWVNRNTITVSRDQFIHGYVPFYTGVVTPEIEAMLEGLGVTIPEMPPMNDEELAKALHDTLCRWNHTDGCSWLYETEPEAWDTGYAHTAWLKKAHELQSLFPNYEGDELVEFAKGLRSILS